jgi:hypothetical protein
MGISERLKIETVNQEEIKFSSPYFNKTSSMNSSGSVTPFLKDITNLEGHRRVVTSPKEIDFNGSPQQNIKHRLSHK